jgi:hypothetical protein
MVDIDPGSKGTQLSFHLLLSIFHLFYVGIHLFLNGFYFSPHFGFHLGQYVFSVSSHHDQQACKHLFL